MERFTTLLPGGGYQTASESIAPLAGGFSGPAIEKLAKYENMQQRLEEEQQRITADMDALKSQGKEKTVKFKELFGRKLANSHVITLLQLHGLG